MNIALTANSSRAELMVQFCTAYMSILSKHRLYATKRMGGIIEEETDLHIDIMISDMLDEEERLGARIACNEIDLVVFFYDPKDSTYHSRAVYLSRICDQQNIPFATNAATAEALMLALDRGDLDWRNIDKLA